MKVVQEMLDQFYEGGFDNRGDAEHDEGNKKLHSRYAETQRKKWEKYVRYEKDTSASASELCTLF